MPINDNSPRITITAASDSHGHAALLLVESLIHGLCENSTLSADQAFEIADRAVSVQLDHAEAEAGAPAPMWKSHALLSRIANSLSADSSRK